MRGKREESRDARKELLVIALTRSAEEKGGKLPYLVLSQREKKNKRKKEP